jgi:hypothetical protein
MIQGNLTRLQVVSDFIFPVLPTADGSGHTVHPSVIYFPEKWNGYQYWMAVSGYKNGMSLFENTHIFVSNDLTTWIPPTGFTNPLDTAIIGEFQSDPNLFYKDGVLHVYYRDGGTLLRRTTRDGVNWTPREHCTTDETIVSPSVHYFSGTWYMWAGKPDRGGGLYIYESDNGIDWGEGISCRYNTRTNMVLWHCDVWKDGGLYHIIASAAINGLNTLHSTQLFYGSSIDGYNWFMDELACVPKGAAPEFAWRVYKACVVRHGNKQLLFASGGDRLNGTQLTGYAWTQLSTVPMPQFPLIDENWINDYSNINGGELRSYGWFKPNPYKRLRGVLKLEHGGKLIIRQGGYPSNAYNVLTTLEVQAAVETQVDVQLDLPWAHIMIQNSSTATGYLRSFLHLMQ